VEGGSQLNEHHITRIIGTQNFLNLGPKFPYALENVYPRSAKNIKIKGFVTGKTTKIKINCSLNSRYRTSLGGGGRSLLNELHFTRKVYYTKVGYVENFLVRCSLL
jgi:hypothetical protein